METKVKSVVVFDAPELQGIEKSKADQIKLAFAPMAEMLTQFEELYNEVVMESTKEITQELCNKAKRLRLDVGRVRIDAGKLKDKQKEYIKLEDKAIMGVHNILVWAVKEKEDALKEIENYFEIQEQKRLQELQSSRAERLAVYVEDAFERDLAKFEDDEFEALFEMKKKAHEDKLEAERIAEEDRIAKEKAEAAEREQQRLENEKLKKEAEKREKEEEEKAKLRNTRSELLRPYIVFIRDYNSLIEKSESEFKKEFEDIKKGAQDHWEFERKEQLRKQKEEEQAEISRKKLESENAAKLKKEQEEKAKLQAELQAKKDAEIKAEKERLEAEEKSKKEAEKLAKAPKKQKLTNWIDGFVMGAPTGLNEDEKVIDILKKFESFKSWAKSEIEKL